MNDNSKPQPDDLTPVMVFPMLNFPIKIMGLNQPEFPVANSPPDTSPTSTRAR